MADCLVTKANPVREVIGMDYERCAALHNYLLDLGLENVEVVRPTGQFVTWWDHNIENSESPPGVDELSKLSPSLIRFLKLAKIYVIREGEYLDYHFFYYLCGLNPLQYILESIEEMRGLVEQDVEDDRFFYLYPATNLASHPGGLMYNSVTDRVIIQMSIHDTFISNSSRQTWSPLEVILSGYIEMVQCKKAAAGEPEPALPGQELYNPWRLNFYSKPIMEAILQAFEALVESIESRMPQLGSSADQPSTSRYGLASKDELDASRIKTAFAREFIRRARRPRFDFIAPGLAVMCDKDLIEQPIEPTEPEPWLPNDYYMPVLLFRNNQTAVDEYCPYKTKLQVPSGFYLSHHYQWPHCGSFRLPFKIGQNGYASGDDGPQKREYKREPFGTMYYGAYNHFIERYGETRLELIFNNWRELIELGVWSVGAHGVAGTIDTFKDADTEERWESYALPTTW